MRELLRWGRNHLSIANSVRICVFGNRQIVVWLSLLDALHPELNFDELLTMDAVFKIRTTLATIFVSIERLMCPHKSNSHRGYFSISRLCLMLSCTFPLVDTPGKPNANAASERGHENVDIKCKMPRDTSKITTRARELASIVWLPEAQWVWFFRKAEAGDHFHPQKEIWEVEFGSR